MKNIQAILIKHYPDSATKHAKAATELRVYLDAQLKKTRMQLTSAKPTLVNNETGKD